MMQLSAATWSGDDSELNLAPSQVALSSANYRAQRLGGCNNHLKGEIKAPLNGVLCSRPHLMPCGFFKPRRGRRFKSALRDREAAGRSSPGHDANGGGGSAAPGRPRTKFSAAQLQELERSFREQRYIGASEKRRLAALLNLSQSQIKTWFQNRRMKFKRQTQDARVEALFSGLFSPYRCYPDIATSSYSHGMDINVSSTSAVSLHPAMPSPALLLPSVPAQSLQPVLPSPTLLLPPSPGLSCYSPVIPAMTLSNNHKRLRFQPYLPFC
ncbi:LOW QUALITY PROTEIN: homeobox protein vex1-like [Morus bassanus]